MDKFTKIEKDIIIKYSNELSKRTNIEITPSIFFKDFTVEEFRYIIGTSNYLSNIEDGGYRTVKEKFHDCLTGDLTELFFCKNYCISFEEFKSMKSTYARSYDIKYKGLKIEIKYNNPKYKYSSTYQTVNRSSDKSLIDKSGKGYKYNKKIEWEQNADMWDFMCFVTLDINGFKIDSFLNKEVYKNKTIMHGLNENVAKSTFDKYSHLPEAEALLKRRSEFRKNILLKFNKDGSSNFEGPEFLKNYIYEIK